MYKNITFFSIIIACLIFSCHTVMNVDCFTDNGDGTVTDHKLGLVFDTGFWLRPLKIGTL